MPGNAKKEPEFDEPLETHIKEITEFIVADAASDELVGSWRFKINLWLNLSI